jgi:cAMP-binding proteins - catabolite gene activator and regulatory subunit of cAMP-dependent protein kinases
MSIASGNVLIDALGPAERECVGTRLEQVALDLNDSIYEANVPISHVHFPTRGIISMVSVSDEGTVEVGTVGREGMAGIPVLLQAEAMATRAFVQVKGASLRMSAADFQQALSESAPFARLMFRYAQALFDQVAQSVACNRLHTLEERCARWLLMAHDRVGADDLALKQQFLAEMLGVHRPAVTLAAGALQKAGLIRSRRGVITVLDRDGLEAASCACYRIARASMDRLAGTGAA